MGLSISLSNAVSGMSVSQNSLEVLSRNVANAGTPGYHRQSLNVVELSADGSPSVRTRSIQRAFNESLQSYYTRAVGDAGFSNVRAEILQRLQTFLGKPGDAGSLDVATGAFQNALQQLGVSPDNFATRAAVIAKAQALAGTLNGLSNEIQSLRQETESKMAGNVATLNQSIESLAKINNRLADKTADPGSRAALMDERDRLVSQIAELIDVRVDYRSDDSVALMTRGGVGILDAKASIFEFQSAGAITPTSRFSTDPSASNVGSLILRTPSGLAIDLVQQDVLKSGELAALVDLRDRALVEAQDQLDTIAAALAKALSTVTTAGTPQTVGATQGFSLDISNIRDGNDFTLEYTENGVNRSLRVLRVDDPSKLPLDYVDANGTRVVGADFTAGAPSVAAAVQRALGGSFSATSPAAGTIRVLDDGAANTTSITALTSHSTVSGVQNGGLGLNLFMDAGGAEFTGSLGGDGQLRGFAGRIVVNSAVAADNKLLVQHQANLSLGDATRPAYLRDQLDQLRFASPHSTGPNSGFRLGGTVTDILSQMLDYQGGVAANALSDQDTQQLTMDTLDARLDSEYGVNVDEEMARLMELQNAYAANARVISTVKELLDRLLNL